MIGARLPNYQKADFAEAKGAFDAFYRGEEYTVRDIDVILTVAKHFRTGDVEAIQAMAHCLLQYVDRISVTESGRNILRCIKHREHFDDDPGKFVLRLAKLGVSVGVVSWLTTPDMGWPRLNLREDSYSVVLDERSLKNYSAHAIRFVALSGQYYDWDRKVAKAMAHADVPVIGSAARNALCNIGQILASNKDTTALGKLRVHLEDLADMAHRPAKDSFEAGIRNAQRNKAERRLVPA